MEVKANDIEEYLKDNKLNKDLYDAIRNIPSPPIDEFFDYESDYVLEESDVISVFNKAYDICDNLRNAEDPQLRFDELYKNVLDGSTLLGKYIKMQNIIFCCVYVILSVSKSSNQDIELCLKKIKNKVDKGIFQRFEPLLNNEIGTKTLSFNYTQIADKPSNITDFMNSLKKFKFISRDTSLTDFKCVFSGKEVQNPIKWTTHFGGLLDLFRQLNKKRLIKYEGTNMYKIVCACFVDKDGNPFKETDFKNGKIAISITDDITKAVALLEEKQTLRTPNNI